MNDRAPMMSDEAQHLLSLSREARWRYPSSSGRPVGDADAPWVVRLVAKQDAFIDAARLFLDQGKNDSAVEIAANVWRLWVMSRNTAAGRAFLASVLDSTATGTPSRFRAIALYGDGLLAFRAGKLDDSIARNKSALAVANMIGDSEALTLANLGLSRAVIDTGDCKRARDLVLSARRHARSLGTAWDQAPLHMHAQTMRRLGDYDQAAELFAESLALNRSIDDRGMVVVELHNLGHVEIRRGNIDIAERCFDECAELADRNDSYGAAMTHLNRAAVAFSRGDYEGANALVARAESALTDLGTNPVSDDDLIWLREQILARPR